MELQPHPITSGFQSELLLETKPPSSPDLHLLNFSIKMYIRKGLAKREPQFGLPQNKFTMIDVLNGMHVGYNSTPVRSYCLVLMPLLVLTQVLIIVSHFYISTEATKLFLANCRSLLLNVQI